MSITTDTLRDRFLLAEASYGELEIKDPQTGKYSRPINIQNPEDRKALELAYNGKYRSKSGEDVTTVPNNLSPTLSKEIMQRFTMLNHQKDTGSGYSGTFFQNKETGHITLAIRGTAGLKDIAGADLRGIIADGVPAKQLIDAYNHVAWAKAPKGTRYERAVLEDVKASDIYFKTSSNGVDKFVNYQEAGAQKILSKINAREEGYVKDEQGKFVPLKQAYPMNLNFSNNTGSSKLVNGPVDLYHSVTDGKNLYFGSRVKKVLSDTKDLGGGIIPPNTKIDVTGHSLGYGVAGPLTQALPDLVDFSVGINGAGRGKVFDYQAHNARAMINGLAGKETHFDQSKHHSFHIDGGKEVVTSSTLLHNPKNQATFGAGAFALDGHAGANGVDTLTAAKVLTTLDPTLKKDASQANKVLLPLMQDGAQKREDCLPSVINHVGEIYGISTKAANDRESQHKAALTLSSTLKQQGQKADVKLMPVEDRLNLTKLIQEDFGAYYAMTKKQGFYLTGGNVDQAYQKKHGQLYQQWKQNVATNDHKKELSGAAGKQLDKEIDGYLKVTGLKEASGKTMLKHPAPSAGDNITKYENQDKSKTVVIGASGGDGRVNWNYVPTKIIGSNKDDILRGSPRGQGIPARLEGGQGHDIYVVGQGKDVIHDSDKKGELRLHSDKIKSPTSPKEVDRLEKVEQLEKLDKTFQIDPNHPGRYNYPGKPGVYGEFLTDKSGRKDFKITFDAKNSVTIEDFKSGDLGVKLANQQKQASLEHRPTFAELPKEQQAGVLQALAQQKESIAQSKTVQLASTNAPSVENSNHPPATSAAQNNAPQVAQNDDRHQQLKDFVNSPTNQQFVTQGNQNKSQTA